jgi:hypothetical protein
MSKGSCDRKKFDCDCDVKFIGGPRDGEIFRAKKGENFLVTVRSFSMCIESGGPEVLGCLHTYRLIMCPFGNLLYYKYEGSRVFRKEHLNEIEEDNDALRELLENIRERMNCE